jgi:histidinol dehydrogenase
LAPESSGHENSDAFDKICRIFNMNNVTSSVAEMIETVRRDGDAALCDFAKRFDGIEMSENDLAVRPHELKSAQTRVSPDFMKAVKECAKQIERFAKNERSQITKSWMKSQGSTRLGQLIRPVDSVGLYIPGGRFPYPSTVLMTAIPARVAGVKRIVLVSPPKNLTPEVMAAAAYAGVEEVYRIGGAGAIAALAFGTKQVKKVDFIVGPGNQYVTEAKRQVFGHVGIDSLAGPSEVVIIADGSVPVEYLQTDLLAQAEHDPEAQSLLLSTDAKQLRETEQGLDENIRSRVRFQQVKNLDAAIEIANEIGPEHLELLFKKAERSLPKIRHAGAIFLGPATTAVLGDYVAGPSHVLPTQRSARFSSGLSVATFLKRSSVIGFESRPGERALWDAALTMAKTEGMEFHARSLRARIERQ